MNHFFFKKNLAFCDSETADFSPFSCKMFLLQEKTHRDISIFLTILFVIKMNHFFCKKKSHYGVSDFFPFLANNFFCKKNTADRNLSQPAAFSIFTCLSKKFFISSARGICVQGEQIFSPQVRSSLPDAQRSSLDFQLRAFQAAL